MLHHWFLGAIAASITLLAYGSALLELAAILESEEALVLISL
ncbi:hypothetical protein AXFE_14620 [Acidithrix ferrooxidans]|uniref:Uncharacterized protein n=1 Tax=Acidithrix ferrooxidans TaxID=1280514 RepID=A0A0D8HIQ5_9ACTN|nr:hypothetical protein AXFE_14620 [Acidithrix ferrooxidans]CAG4903490.1 unnamed protein product [Acidithrix sp. C25]